MVIVRSGQDLDAGPRGGTGGPEGGEQGLRAGAPTSLLRSLRFLCGSGRIGWSSRAVGSNGRIGRALGPMLLGRSPAPSGPQPPPPSCRNSARYQGRSGASWPGDHRLRPLLRAVQSRDPRFDGWFFTAVTTRHLLPTELSGQDADAGQRSLLPLCRRSPTRRFSSLQAMPARRHARLARVEHPGGRDRSGDALDRRRARGPGRRTGTCGAARLQRPPTATHHARRGRRRTARRGSGAKGPNGPGPDRDDRR